MAEILNDAVFEEKTNEGVVLVDFYADWCAPCKMVSPLIDEISEEREDVGVYKVNIEDSAESTVKYKVRSLPTIIVLKDGKEVNKIIGTANKAQINDLIDSAL